MRHGGGFPAVQVALDSSPRRRWRGFRTSPRYCHTWCGWSRAWPKCGCPSGSWSRVLSSYHYSAFCPCPRRQEPDCANFAKRNRVHRARLCDLVASESKGHGRRNNHVGVVAGDIHMLRLAEPICGSPKPLSARPRASTSSPPVFGWQSVLARRGATFRREFASGRRMSLPSPSASPLLNAVDILAHRRHRIVRARHNGSPYSRRGLRSIRVIP